VRVIKGLKNYRLRISGYNWDRLKDAYPFRKAGRFLKKVFESIKEYLKRESYHHH